MPDDFEARIARLEAKLERTQRALSLSMGLSAGIAHVLSMEFPAGRAQLELVLLECLDVAADEPVTGALLRDIIARLSRTG